MPLILFVILMLSNSLVFSQHSIKNNVTPYGVNQQGLLLSEFEFNQLLVASLANDFNGKQLLEVADSVSTKIHETYVEISALINLDKVEKVNPQARQSIERFENFLFFLDKNNLKVTVFVQPIINNGLIGVRDNFSLKLGPIPLSNDSLRQLGVQVEQVNSTYLKLNNIVLRSLQLNAGSILIYQ